MKMRPLIISLTLLAALSSHGMVSSAQAEMPSMRIHAGITQAISDHVHVIPAEGRAGVPNVGIIVGSRAVLVIESGLGVSSGQTILDEVRRIAGNRRVYVIATHLHPEHIGGEQAFTRATVLRLLAQQREIEASDGSVIEAFREMSPDNRRLLEGFSYRPADIVFEDSLVLDLGGVVVDIMSAGHAHTDGDIALFVRGDGVLFTGDVVQQNYAPLLMGQHSSVASWLERIDQLEKLPAGIVVPSHSAITGREAFGDMREMVIFLRDNWEKIRKLELSESEAASRLAADFEERFPECGNAAWVKMSIPKL